MSTQKSSTKKFQVKSRIAGKTQRHKLHMYGESVTKQSFKDDCDINLIMAKFIKTGVMDHQKTYGAEYGFASSDDFRDSMELISKAETMFEELPSKIRNKFDNNPASFLDFVQDPANLTEMQELGLANKTPQKETKPKADQTAGREALEQGTQRVTEAEGASPATQAAPND